MIGEQKIEGSRSAEHANKKSNPFFRTSSFFLKLQVAFKELFTFGRPLSYFDVPVVFASDKIAICGEPVENVIGFVLLANDESEIVGLPSVPLELVYGLHEPVLEGVA